MISARWIRISCLFLTIALSCSALAASPFTGTYALGEATAAGPDVQLTISLTIANSSGADVSNAMVAVQEPTQAGVSYGSLSGVNIAAHGMAQVSGSFTVPRALYAAWQKGSTPAISISYANAQGKAVRAYVQF